MDPAPSEIHTLPQPAPLPIFLLRVLHRSAEIKKILKEAAAIKDGHKYPHHAESGLQRSHAEPPLPSLSMIDRKSTRLNSSHHIISYAVFCLNNKRHNLCIGPH